MISDTFVRETQPDRDDLGDVTLGHDADEEAVDLYEQCADAVCVHHLGGVEYRCQRVDQWTSLPFASSAS